MENIESIYEDFLKRKCKERGVTLSQSNPCLSSYSLTVVWMSTHFWLALLGFMFSTQDFLIIFVVISSDRPAEMIYEDLLIRKCKETGVNLRQSSPYWSP